MVEPIPLLFTILGVEIYSHAAFFAIGALVSYFSALYLSYRLNLEEGNLIWLVFWVFAFGLIGARAGYFIVYPDSFTSIWDMLAIWNGGLLSYAGIITGGLTANVLIRLWWPQLWARWADILVLATLFGWCVGRIGNFLAGDSVGVLSKFWYFTYGRVPIQLFESFSCLVISLIGIRYLMWRRPYPGLIALTTSAAYFAVRTLIDLWRDEPSLFLGLKPSVVTAAFLGAVLICVIARHATHKTTI